MQKIEVLAFFVFDKVVVRQKEKCRRLTMPTVHTLLWCSPSTGLATLPDLQSMVHLIFTRRIQTSPNHHKQKLQYKAPVPDHFGVPMSLYWARKAAANSDIEASEVVAAWTSIIPKRCFNTHGCKKEHIGEDMKCCS